MPNSRDKEEDVCLLKPYDTKWGNLCTRMRYNDTGIYKFYVDVRLSQSRSTCLQ